MSDFHLVGSGNLTFGGWGRNLELCEVLSPISAQAAFEDMADFLEALATAPRLDFPGAAAAASWAPRRDTRRGASHQGHKTAAMVMHYTHVNDERVDNALSVMEAETLGRITPKLHTALKAV